MNELTDQALHECLECCDSHEALLSYMGNHMHPHAAFTVLMQYGDMLRRLYESDEEHMAGLEALKRDFKRPEHHSLKFE